MLKLIQLIALSSLAMLADAQEPAAPAPPVAATSPQERVAVGQRLHRDTGFRSRRDTVEEENIIITKKGNSRDKMTIVVDGDNITVNGRPVDAFESSVDGKTIKIRRAGGDVRLVRVPRPPRAARAPRAPRPPMAFGFSGEPRAFLGVNSSDSAGMIVLSNVVRKSPADSAGLQKGDVLLSIDGKALNPDAGSLWDRMGELKPGQKVRIAYRRNGKERSTEVKLGKQDGAYAANFELDMERFGADMERFGADMERWGEEYGRQFEGFGQTVAPGAISLEGRLMSRPRLGLNIEDLPQGDGVRLFEAPEAETVAGKAGLKQGDVITTVNGKPVKDVDAMREQVRDLKPGDKLTIGYLRNGQSATTELVVPKRIKKAGL